MATMDDHMERLIARQLDGELSEDESLALTREIMRNPEAREAAERGAHIDTCAAKALSAALGDGQTSIDLDTLPEQQVGPSARPYRSVWWLMPGAVAAALAVMVLTGPWFSQATCA